MTQRALVLITALAFNLAACKDPPSRWDQAASAKPTAAAHGAEVKPGSAFNAFFPADGTDGMSRVFTQEKAGFAEAHLKKDGKDVATLSISDTAGEADAKGKFATAADKLDGMPLVTVGKHQSAVLVKDRYQVKVSSQTLDEEARKALLGKFHLKGLAGL